MRGAGSKLCLLTGTDMEGPKARPTPRDASRDTGSPGVRAPVKGESSSSDLHLVSDGDTPVDPSKIAPDPEATLVDVDATVGDRTLSPSPPQRMASGLFASAAVLRPGDVLGGRYEILQLLGEGGMGAVYKARDRELNRFVALKVIRPQLAASPAILARFKQELLLAHQVTHKNVIRIYDLAEADGVKFITMEFIEGVDLRHLLLEHGKLPPAEAVEVIRQVCLALDAAHSVGVIHRDLKPQNIMQDKQGRILVMDFGLARSVESEGMTQTGALVGTMEYMSPEQALGNELDQRSDLFALGLIFFELLTGKVPYKAETALASLLKRNQERAISAVELDLSIPKGVSDIVAKCLERNLDQRYQNGQEILNDLDAWQGKRPISASSQTAARRVAALPWKWIGAAALAIVVAAGGWELRLKIGSRGATTHGPVTSLAILPFRNASGDQSLDWLGPSVADMLSTDIGQSPQLRTVSPNRVHQILTDLHISSATALDPPTIRRVADFSNADRVVWGQYARFGDQIRIDATLQDIKNEQTVPLKVDIPSANEIPGAIDRLAEAIRQKLALPEDVLKELKASSFQPTSGSVEALRAYNQGIGLQRDGKNLEAQREFETATKADPTFALAFSKLAQTYASLGYDGEAGQSAKKAADLSQNLPQAEKYLIAAVQAQIAKNFPEAIRAYENLAKASPDNADVQSALATLYEQTGDIAKATEYNRKILVANPNDINATLAMGRLAIKSGKPQAGLDPLNRALTLSIQLDSQEQKATSLHLIGLAYWKMNKPEEALRNYQEELAMWRQIGQKVGIALSVNEIGKMQALLGNNKAALSSFQEALTIRRDIGDRRGLGDSLIDLGNFLDDRGDHDQALKNYKEALQIQRDIGNETLQATCLNNIGAVYFEKAQYEDARTYYQQALQLREKSKLPGDIVNSVFNLAEVSVRIGEYDQAVAQYMRALELYRSMDDARGAAIDSYTLGTMFDYQGRFGAAVNSKQEAFNTFQSLKDKTTWMADIQAGYGQSLVLAGRGEEAKTHLNDALNLARELKNDGLVAQTLGFQGDAAYYRGDSKSARALYAQALQAATRSREPDRILTANVNLAQVNLQEGQGQHAVASLRRLMQQAEDQGVPNISVECSIYLAEAMIQSHDHLHAQQELERALLRTDKVGLKPLSAEAHYLLGASLRASGNQAEARQHYRDTLQLLDGMRNEPGADKILLRSDFKTMYDESTRWSKAAKN
jgi:tetratricopeptide (TPR) repeat protein/TolB-like protein